MSASITAGDIELFDERSKQARDLLLRFGEEILESAFPPEEYAPSTFSGEGTPDEPLLVACGRDGSILGGAYGEVFVQSNTLLLAYLAVREDARDAGLGSLLMTAIGERWLDSGRLALVEIEDPRHHATSPKYGDPMARVRFYARFGVKALAVPYFQPRLGPELARPYHILLGALATPAPLRTNGGVAGAPVQEFLREYFITCEGEEALQDEDLQWLLEFYRAPEIQLVPIDDLQHIPDLAPPSLTNGT